MNASRRTTSPRKGRYRALRHILLILIGFVMLYPILWMFVGSLRPESEIFSDPGLIPSSVSLESYLTGWTRLGIPFERFYLNSLIVAGGAILGNLVACSMAAYAFARIEFPLRRAAFAAMLGTLMLPYHVTIVPQYILFNHLDWINTFWPLIVPKLFATDAFFIFLMVQFLRALPPELDDAARVDGAGHIRTFVSVILPLMTPALGTTAIFTFIWTWNDFFAPQIYLSNPNNYTVPLALRSFVDQTSQTAWGPLLAMSLLSVGPVIGFFLIGQRYLVRGIATTGLK